MDSTKENAVKLETNSEGNTQRSQSQDALDSSSASSLSFLADQSDGQNSREHANHLSEDDLKSGNCCPRVPMDEALKSEEAFIEFVMSLPPKETSGHHHSSADSVSVPKSKSPAAASSTTKVGLDHLDNLCKLMEQLSELRETNYKLQRRVQYLEDLKTLHDMHKEINEEEKYSSETALENKPQFYELKKSATETCCPKKEEMQSLQSHRSHSKCQRRGRAQSTDGQRRERSKSVGHDDSAEDTKSKRLFPKWSKVKEAFGWESDRKESVKMKRESDTGTTRQTRRCSDDFHQSFQPNSPTWSQDYPSLHSSLEDVSEIFDSGKWKRCSVVSEKSALQLETPKDALRRQKSTPSPGSEKLVSYRDTTDLKPKSSTIERDTYGPTDYKEDGKRGKGPWGRVKTIIERRRDSLKRRSLRRDHICSECDTKKDEADYLDSADRSKQYTASDSCKQKHFPSESIVIDPDVDYAGTRTPSSSPTFHRKSRWTRVKKALKGKKEDDPSQSTPASPNSVQDGHFTFDAIEEISQDSYEENQEIKRTGSESHMHQMVLSEPTCDLMLQLQRNLSEDFHRKIMEWERIRSSGNSSCSPHWDRKSSMATRSRKKSDRDDKNIKTKLKDLTWLEKELQKIEKEKQRLCKERQKYEERAMRLEKLKETVLNANNSNKREVLVRTSAGEFRFEGISDAFTKKLYEWETKRGLGPELSTIALLDSSRLMVQPSLGTKSGPLQRVVSRSESSLADIGQPSHNSSNSLPSIKITDAMDVERANEPSRANSEPDLSTLVALTNGSNVSASNLSRQTGDFMDDEATTSPGVSRESEEDCELDSKEKKRDDSETYYGLLEENVILLEQLKDKEEICSRLENQLDVLDKRVDVMNKHHTQETERYREKLWEMHKPGATPRDVQCCLRTMSQLRKRIEVLEKCTEKLKNDRESVEDSFRYHSKQQEDMTIDLLQKMRELQAAGSSASACESKEKFSPTINTSAVERLQDLSTLLVKQTQEMQETLSSKTRQICQLRWELLHRDLSAVKLETELHTNTAHRKRSKYANYRSHSSEEAPVVPLQQELDHGKSNLITEAYYNVTSPESEFQATQLTNTVQQLNRELLKLANATEYPYSEVDDEKICTTKVNTEESWTKPARQQRNADKSKQITVRRSSAENVNVVPGKDEAWKQNISSSLDSDDSSDDGYTKVSFHPNRNSHSFNPSAERLLMSRGEHPPRGYLQRRKKLQKSKTNSSPSRKRSNTFHNKRDFEKTLTCEIPPQKCHSFRLTREKNYDNSGAKNKLDAINIRNLLGEVKYQEFLRRKAAMVQNNQGWTTNASSISTQKIIPDIKTRNQWLREVASDSKIPFLIQEHIADEELAKNRYNSKYPVRSFSDKHKKENAVERRENMKRKNRKQLTLPDLFANIKVSESRLQSVNIPNQIIPKADFIKEYSAFLKNTNTLQSEKTLFKPPSDIPSANTETATVTLQLPKRKSKKTQPKSTEIKSENNEHSVSVSIPKKRSLSCEQELENSLTDSFKLKQAEKYKHLTSNERNENSSISSFTESHLDQNNTFIANEMGTNDFKDVKSFTQDSFGIAVCDTSNDTLQPRKRKAQDRELLKESSSNEKGNEPLIIKDMVTNDSQVSVSNKLLNTPEMYIPTSKYVKSPSAPHLDWRKVCAKKVSREDTSNVRSLIEKYNRVAESHSLKSTNSSTVSSPMSSRKISSPSLYSKKDHSRLSYSSSTPTTPSVMLASTFYNPLVFKPMNLDLFPTSPPPSPMSVARSEALKKAKEQFISSQNTLNLHNSRKLCNQTSLHSTRESDRVVIRENRSSSTLNTTQAENFKTKKPDDDRISNSSMDSMSYVMFRTGETCQESRLSKRSVDHSKSDSNTLERNKLKTSKSLSNSSIFKTVLNSEFKMPSTLLKLKRSKRKKDMTTVSHLCRQSLFLTPEDTGKIATQSSHKSCPSSPELKSKREAKLSWFQRNIFRHK